MTYIISFPVLAIVIALYLVFASGGMPMMGDAYDMTLASGAEMALSMGDFFVIGGLLALFVEILKAARAGRGTIVDHILSTAVFVGALVAFLLYEPAGTSTFLILTVMALVDVVAGFSVSIFSSRRDLTFDR